MGLCAFVLLCGLHIVGKKTTCFFSPMVDLNDQRWMLRPVSETTTPYAPPLDDFAASKRRLIIPACTYCRSKSISPSSDLQHFRQNIFATPRYQTEVSFVFDEQLRVLANCSSDGLSHPP